MALLPCLSEVLAEWKRCFHDRRTFRRAQDHALALLVSLGRRTISRCICVLGRQWRNWTADYRFFSQCRWDSQALFDRVLEQLPALLSPTQPLLVACKPIISAGKKPPNFSSMLWTGTSARNSRSRQGRL
jgi:hypothetical protein